MSSGTHPLDEPRTSRVVTARARDDGDSLRSTLEELRRTERDLERSRKEAERLVRFSAAIADAVDIERIAGALTTEMGDTLGAASAALWLRNGNTAHLVGSSGYTPHAVRSFGAVPLVPGRAPITDCLIEGRPIWIDSKEDLVARYPLLSTNVTPDLQYRIACLPVVVEDQTSAVVAFTFEGDARLDEAERQLLLMVARHTAQALARVHLLGSQRRARVRAEILYRLAAAFIEAETIDEAFDATLDALEEALHANRTAVLLLEGDGTPAFRAHRGLSRACRVAMVGHAPLSADARAPEPVLVSDVSQNEALSRLLPALSEEGIGALAFFPLVAQGKLTGMLIAAHDGPRTLSSSERELARAIGNHAAAAIVRFEALAELKRTVHMNELFTAILGHDLRNPLGAILTAAEMAIRTEDGRKLERPLERIVKSGTRMARMIDQLLDFTRARVGAGIPIHRRPVDLEPLIRQVLDELDDANPDIALELSCRGDTTGTFDADRLGQVFSNLVGNAVQHGEPSQGVRVTIDGTLGSRVTVTVENGGTIPAHVLPIVFEPLAGGPDARQHSSGLGLGLFITREVVNAHGGAISVRSSEADGTIFSVVLPRAPSTD